MNDGPLIVQSDKTLLLEIDHERAQDCRKAIAPFAELERSPEHIHTYRLTPLGLWNARAAGHDAEQVVDTLLEYSRYAVPHALLVDVAETMARYGRLRLEKNPIHGLVLASTDRPVLEEVLRAKKIAGMIGERVDDDTVVVHASERGNLKQALLKLGWPAEDFAGYVDGEAHPIFLDETEWHLRDYQRDAADSFWHGGSGVVVLPCGAGKTLVGAAAMAQANSAPQAVMSLQAVKAVPVQSNLNEAYTSLQTGVYDGWIMIPDATYSFKLHEVARYYTITSFGAIPNTLITMNRATWKKLPREIQEIFLEVGREYTKVQTEASQVKGEQAIQAMKDAGANIEYVNPKEGALAWLES